MYRFHSWLTDPFGLICLEDYACNQGKKWAFKRQPISEAWQRSDKLPLFASTLYPPRFPIEIIAFSSTFSKLNMGLPHPLLGIG